MELFTELVGETNPLYGVDFANTTPYMAMCSEEGSIQIYTVR
jgi:hypothetical protein